MLLWIYLWLKVAVQYSEGSTQKRDVPQQCQGSGEPCIEFVTANNHCHKTDLKQSAALREIEPTPDLEEEGMDLYPWWIPEGSNKRLCCDVKLAEPLLIDTLTMEWYYYPKLDDFGSGGFKVIKSDNTSYHVEEIVKSSIYRGMLSVNITSASAASEGAYACRVTANTKPPGVEGTTRLTIGQISEPIVIKVYSENLEFQTSDEEHKTHQIARIADYAKKPYVFIDYKVKSINPRKKLIVSVDTDTSLLQYVDMHEQNKMLISTFGDKEYLSSQFNKSFTVNVYYEGEESKKIQRTWFILGGYGKSENTVIRPEMDELKPEFDKMFSFFVIGSCERFVYKVQLNDTSEPEILNFDGSFPSTFQEINDGKYNLKYRFNNNYCSGDLKTKNSFVELTLSRSDYALSSSYTGNSNLQVAVSCTIGAKAIEPQDIYFLGIPWFPAIGESERNCLRYSQDSVEDYFGIKTTRHYVCCKTEGNLYSNTHLWVNGRYLDPETSDMFTEKTGGGKDVLLQHLYDTNSADDYQRYRWYEKFAGYFQCFVGRYSYLIGTGKREPRYPSVKTRRYKIGFKHKELEKEMAIDLNRAQSYRPRISNDDRDRLERSRKKVQDVTAYQILVSDRELIVVNGSCVGLTARAVVFPHEKLIWEAKDVAFYADYECTEPYVEEKIENKSVNFAEANPSFTYSYQPYDKVTIENKAYVGFVNAKKTTVTVKLEADSSQYHVITLMAKTPFLEDPLLRFSAPGVASSITCICRGYPIERANLTARVKKSSKTVVLDSFDVNRDEKEEDHEIVLSAPVDSSMESVDCTVFNNLVREKKNRKAHDKVKIASSSDVTLIVVTVIGIALLILVIWIVCACVAMARNPQTKFGEAMCCRTGPYSQVEKIPMDPYKLEYFTLNPSVTLGGGHFGIVRRGFCTVLPDRAGERTEIAIKEVKPCIDRLRREDDLRRERDIMMRLRGHSNVLRIYGYTDEPDQLALVMEFAAFGSLDKLLMEARKIKSDGYLMPNEQIENPIQAFESQHIVDFGRQISDGMDYISRNQIVHRDLAARNIVVSGEDGEYVLKITDFGLAREICDDGFYERVEGKEIPIKWTAPESLRGNIYTSKSDVWSFGITLWEICTLGGEPYAGYNNVETMEKLRSGYRLQKPPSCNKDLYDLMSQCWLESPDERPDFQHILTQLTTYSQKPTDYVHIDSLYETDLNLTVRLQTLQPPPNNRHPSSSSPPSSPVRHHVTGAAESRDSCNSPRDYHPPADDAAAVSMATNEYSMEPSSLPHNEAV